jgi:hypothetical protein
VGGVWDHPFRYGLPRSGHRTYGVDLRLLIESTHAVAEAGMLGALLGLRARQAPRYGWLGAVGFALAFLGSALLCAITVIAIITGDALGEAVLGTIFISGVVGWLVGFPLLGIATLRARVLPRWCGVLLLAYFPLFGFLLSSYGWGGIALGLLWLALGYALLSASGATVQQPSRVT